VVKVGEQTLEAEDLTGQHGLLIDQVLVGEFHDAASFLHEKHVLSDLIIVDDPFIGIEGEFLPQRI